ncbi:effector-associated constant component EACC1 [Streptomyces phaeoluteigriseus]|uniref:effector-associated constant component EACC1 n=1 Tax=Streptomyces phaeoluteigriseus TaxID=114686 RepID=UPI0036B3F635
MTDPGPGISASLDATGTEDDLRSLLRWLRADETAGVRAGLAAAPPPPAGGMGPGFDMLQFAVSGGLSAAALVVSVLQWQTSLRRAPAVTLRRGDVEVQLTAQAARDEETVRRFVALLDGDTAPAAPPAQRTRTEGSGGDDGTA